MVSGATVAGRALAGPTVTTARESRGTRFQSTMGPVGLRTAILLISDPGKATSGMSWDIPEHLWLHTTSLSDSADRVTASWIDLPASTNTYTMKHAGWRCTRLLSSMSPMVGGSRCERYARSGRAVPCRLGTGQEIWVPLRENRIRDYTGKGKRTWTKGNIDSGPWYHVRSALSRLSFMIKTQSPTKRARSTASCTLYTPQSTNLACVSYAAGVLQVPPRM